jgi:hypothetical protein
MAENNALDTKEKADAWLAGEVVEGISITIDDFKNSRRNAGWTEQQIKNEIDKIAVSVTRQANEAVKTDPALVSSSGNTSASSLGISETKTVTETESETDESGIPEYTAETDDVTVDTSDTYRMGKLLFEKQEDGNFLVTDTETGEAGLYGMDNPSQNMRDAYLIRGTNNGHVLWNNRDLTGYRQTNESSPLHMDYAPEWKTTRKEAIQNATSGPEYDKALLEEVLRVRQLQRDDPETWTEERVQAEIVNWKNQRIINANVDWDASPYGGGVDEGRISGTGGGSGPQLGDLPSFSSQAEIDKDRYDSTSAAGRALMAGQSLPKFSMATSPGTARFFGNRSEMAMPTLQSLGSMTAAEAANYNAAARMFQKPEYGDLVNLSRERWGGRRTAPTATMGGMAGGFSGFGGFNQGSSIMPPRASRPTRSTSATSQSPFGFQAQGRGGVKRAAFNRPSRLRASSIRSGRDGMIRGRGA